MHLNKWERFGPIVILWLCTITAWRRRTWFCSFAFLMICCSGFLWKSATLPAGPPGQPPDLVELSPRVVTWEVLPKPVLRGCFWACAGCRAWDLMSLTSLRSGISPARGGWDGKASRLHHPTAGCDPLTRGAWASGNPLLQHCCQQPPQPPCTAFHLDGNLLFSEVSCPLAVQKKKDA